MDRQNLLIFDGACALCSRAVRFILAHERDHLTRFASAQSSVGRAILQQNGLDPEKLASLVLVREGAIFVRSNAVLEVARHLRLPWRMVRVFRFVPRSLRDPLYDVVARNRHRWFGRQESCAMADPETRSRFLDR